MIRINLLPHREMRRQQRKKEFNVHAGIVAAIGVGIAFGVGMLINSQIDAQETRNRFIQTRIADLDAQIKEIANLEEEIESLRARQESVEQLQSNRTIPVHLMYELVEVVPEGVYLTRLSQNGSLVSLTGRAQTTERIADLLRNLTTQAPTLDKPQLGEIKAITLRSGGPTGGEARRLFEFSMNVVIKNPAEEKTDQAQARRPSQVASR
jgi:type IV pilus assembly protein PilN